MESALRIHTSAHKERSNVAASEAVVTAQPVVTPKPRRR